jgi:hypothetical protein
LNEMEPRCSTDATIENRASCFSGVSSMTDNAFLTTLNSDWSSMDETLKQSPCQNTNKMYQVSRYHSLYVLSLAGFQGRIQDFFREGVHEEIGHVAKDLGHQQV